jgi:hypothetical protein
MSILSQDFHENFEPYSQPTPEWFDAFSWFNLDTTCTTCSHQENLISLETM